ncbi:MAG: ABC transporter permease [Microthrixaceae bacterium]|nr:ABC transporter permease [Microthrixaceae bacterium]MCO5313950.1 ABC transporter permease [Microthrixaceae bacterium]
MADETRRPARFAPWVLLSPGGLFMVAFFLAPVLTLVRSALSSRPSRFENPEFSWEFSNFSTALVDYLPQFGRSFLFAGIATLLAFLIGYPLAYFIAVHGGRWKDLLIGLVVIPFFTSFLIRTIAWTSILGNQSFVTDLARKAFGDGFNFLGTPMAVVGGLTYNFLPFMILPIYVALEKIDFRFTEAAEDLYASPIAAFWRVIFPLSLPGVFAGSLLVFIPAAGDFINVRFLGTPKLTTIGSVVQDQFLVQLNYPVAAAISLVLMAIITVAVLIYSKLFGTDGLAA